MSSMEDQHASSGILQKEIRSQSEKEVSTILERAEKEAQKILDDARSDAESIRSDHLRKAEARAEGIRKRILSGVHLEVKRQTLRTREELLSKIFSGVEAKMNALRKTKAYGNIVKKWVIEGILALETEMVRVLPGDVEKEFLTKEVLTQAEKEIQERTGRKVTITVAERILPDAGVVVVSSDERMLFDNRFSTRIQRRKNEMRLEAVNRVMEK